MARLPNGAGSVTKLKGRRARPWWARAATQYDEEGNPFRPSVGMFKTKSAAIEAISLYNYESDPVNFTLSEMYEMYKKDRRDSDAIMESTLIGYDEVYIHLKPLENRKFIDLRLADFQKLFNNMTKKNSKKDEPLSKATKKKVKSVLSSIYKFAIKNEYTENDYSIHIELGRGIETENKEIFDDLKINKMFKMVDEIQDLDIVLIFLFTGLRPGELLKISKDNVDLDFKVFHDFGIKTSKGKKRIMPIADKIFAFVEKRYNETDYYLFKNTSGEVMTPSYFRRHRFAPAMLALGFQDMNVTPYSTRHTFASLLERNKVSGTIQKDLMGHEKFSTTVNNYHHTNIDDLRDAVNSI